MESTEVTFPLWINYWQGAMRFSLKQQINPWSGEGSYSSPFSGLSAGGWISELNQGSVRKEEEAQWCLEGDRVFGALADLACSQIRTWILTQALTSKSGNFLNLVATMLWPKSF